MNTTYSFVANDNPTCGECGGYKGHKRSCSQRAQEHIVQDEQDNIYALSVEKGVLMSVQVMVHLTIKRKNGEVRSIYPYMRWDEVAKGSEQWDMWDKRVKEGSHGG